MVGPVRGNVMLIRI